MIRDQSSPLAWSKKMKVRLFAVASAVVLASGMVARADVSVKMKAVDQPAAKEPPTKGAPAPKQKATEGEAKLGDRTYKVRLETAVASGEFHVDGVHVLVDRNGNGRFDKHGENFEARTPFNVGGTTYEIKELSKDGLSFKFAKSSKTAAEEALEPTLVNGGQAILFEAKMMDGKTVKFPGDYKGKIVMIDFWATWCPPCMGEMPNVVTNYNKYHEKGFEILGVTLDKQGAAEKIKSVGRDKGMKWSQVYDGGFWDARIAKLYEIHSIPKAYLVDGDTGKILSTEIRGDDLGPAIEKALAEKNKH
jgi:thiol-disulfide isomerase/thioredoxin